jgi:hypothetical protein
MFCSTEVGDDQGCTHDDSDSEVRSCKNFTTEPGSAGKNAFLLLFHDDACTKAQFSYWQ